MSFLGVHFAVDAGIEARLLAADGDEEVMEIVEEVEEAWDRAWLCQTDKAWDALHRCLSDGTLDFEGGDYPLSHAILGGLQLYEDDDYVVAYLDVDDVRAVAEALAPLGQDWLRERYFSLDPADYRRTPDEEDFKYTWANMRGLKAFFGKAAEAGRPVVFTVDG